jgi:hypothetical protein
MRDADDWPEVREKLREIVKARGWNSVAREIPVGRSTLFRLVNGETSAPSLPTQDCIERLVDDEELRRATKR